MLLFFDEMNYDRKVMPELDDRPFYDADEDENYFKGMKNEW